MRTVSSLIPSLPPGLYVKLVTAGGQAGSVRSAKKMARQRIEFLRGGVQLLTHEQAHLAETGVVKAYAGVEPDGRLVLQLRAVRT